MKVFGEMGALLTKPLLRTEWHVRHIERLALNLSYPHIVRYLVSLVTAPALSQRVSLVVDHTGVGRPVFDMLVAAVHCPLTGVTIAGGDKVSWDGNTVRVPKRDLVGVVQVALQNSLLKIASALPHSALLVSELQNFKVRIDPVTSHDSYSSWREADHDDLVLAVSLACWAAQESKPIGFVRIEGASPMRR